MDELRPEQTDEDVTMSNPTVVGPFVKAAASGQQDNCVEVAPLSDGGRAIRDSKRRTGPLLLVTRTGWNTFADSLIGGGLG